MIDSIRPASPLAGRFAFLLKRVRQFPTHELTFAGLLDLLQTIATGMLRFFGVDLAK